MKNLPLSQQKSAVVLQRADSGTQTGVGELKFHLIALETARISLAGMKTLVWFAMEVRGRTQTVLENSDMGFFYLLIFHPLFPVIAVGFCPQFHCLLGYFMNFYFFFFFFLE